MRGKNRPGVEEFSNIKECEQYLKYLEAFLKRIIDTIIPHFIVFHFIALYRYRVFHKFKVCGNPASSKSMGAIFLTVFAHVVSLCHILKILKII